MSLDQMEKFYIEASEKIKALLTCQDQDLWKKNLEELFKETNSQLGQKKYFLFIYKLPNYSQNYLFYHLINISFLSLCIANEMKFDQERLKNLFIMCLLHDRGEFNLSSELLNSLYKEDKESHEIIKVADIFDSIINPPPYRKLAVPWLASEAIKEIIRARQDIFDSKIVETFFKVITIYPPDSWVMLTNGLIGRVKEVNREHILRPKVEIAAHIEGKKMDPHLIDLSQEPLLNIQEALSDSEVQKILTRS